MQCLLKFQKKNRICYWVYKDHSILQRLFIRQHGLKRYGNIIRVFLKTANNSNKCLNSHISKCERVKLNQGHIFCERTWGYYE